MNNNAANYELFNYTFWLTAYFNFDANPGVIEALRGIIL